MQAAANYCKNNEPENHFADVVQFLIFPFSLSHFNLTRKPFLSMRNAEKQFRRVYSNHVDVELKQFKKERIDFVLLNFLFSALSDFVPISLQ